MWIQVDSNSVWVRPNDVSAVEGKGYKGSKGSVIHLRGGQSIPTKYPATELAVLLGL